MFYIYIYIYDLSFINSLESKNRFRIIYKETPDVYRRENTSAAIGRIKGEEEEDDGQIEEEDRDLFETTICFHRVT